MKQYIAALAITVAMILAGCTAPNVSGPPRRTGTLVPIELPDGSAAAPRDINGRDAGASA